MNKEERAKGRGGRRQGRGRGREGEGERGEAGKIEARIKYDGVVEC